MICINDMESSVLVVSENGYGKRSAVEDYRITNRGGKGVKTINVTDADDLMVINKSGITIRIGVDTLRVMGRATQGVKIIRLREDDSIASVASVSKWEEEEELLLDEEGNVIENVVIDVQDAITNETDKEENEDNNTNENKEENEEN